MDDAMEEFRLFPGINEAWELVRTGLVVIRETLYKLEVWHSFSNNEIPFYVATYVQEQGVWKRMPDAPFAEGPNEDEALRRAMAFLSERLAA